MKNKVTYILFTAIGLIIAGTSSTAHAQNPIPRVAGKILWKKDKGIIKLEPKVDAFHPDPTERPSPNPCSRFYVAAIDGDGNMFISTNQLTQGPNEGDFYVCNYSLPIRFDQRLRIVAGFGSPKALPKLDTTSPQYSTAAWYGGSNARPAKGETRGFTGDRMIVVKKTLEVVTKTVDFEMVYIKQ